MTPERYQDQYTLKDGTKRKIDEMKYCCYHKRRKLCECDGQVTYKAKRVDQAVYKALYDIFKEANVPLDEIKKSPKHPSLADKASQRKRWHEIEQIKRKIQKMQSEIGDALIGESAFEPDVLAEQIKNSKLKLEEMEERYKLSETEIEDKKAKGSISVLNSEKLKGWAKEFELASMERKKAITSYLINRVEINKMGIFIDFNIDYQQFVNKTHNDIIPFVI